jgi:hypothetical protein
MASESALSGTIIRGTSLTVRAVAPELRLLDFDYSADEKQSISPE